MSPAEAEVWPYGGTKPIGFRAPRQSGKLRFRDGSDLPRAPLVAIYMLCNQFWRRETGRTFHPDFRALGWGEDFDLTEQLSFLNGPALFFVLVAQAVDFFNYTARRCSLVHDGNYKKLNRRIP